MLSIGEKVSNRAAPIIQWLSIKWVWVIVYVMVVAGAVVVMSTVETLAIQESPKLSIQSSKVVKQEVNLAQFHLFGMALPKVTEFEQHQWKLQGIVMSPKQEGVAILLVNDKTLFLKSGDKINAHVIVHKIEQDKILVLDNGQLKRLSLFKVDEPSVAHRASANVPPLDQPAFTTRKLSPAQQGMLQRQKSR